MAADFVDALDSVTPGIPLHERVAAYRGAAARSLADARVTLLKSLPGDKVGTALDILDRSAEQLMDLFQVRNQSRHNYMVFQCGLSALFLACRAH